ncbi:hypothetical protein HBE96_08655 [Clostridium sp. P21]|uniref:Uncharacterized protein n=1 Tax=Clostridium muellerianum TaxID=2716538 RepID=A0A7Y0EG10_9CLOT|nr:hypothetical protein [Clostridium muellerianum]NMM62765.1 hypothetical protein [Clostridium muellerianum]
MNKEKVVQCLSENGLNEIEDLSYNDEAIVLRFFYDFDDEELSAAEAYSNDESEEEAKSNKWYYDYFLPYLSDLAVDNVGEIIEDIMEDTNLEAQYTTYELDKENYDYNEFVAAFYEKGKEVDLDKILDKLEE